MAFKFEIKSGIPVPEVVRQSGVGFGFPFESMKNGDCFDIPVDFWKERDVTKTDTKYLREKIQRAFYQWRKASETRKNKAIVIDDLMDEKKKNLIGHRVFVTTADGAATAGGRKADKAA